MLNGPRPFGGEWTLASQVERFAKSGKGGKDYGKGLPWKEPGTQGKIGPFSLPSLVSSIFLFNFAESIVSFFGIGESATRHGVLCEKEIGGLTSNNDRWALAVCKMFFLTYMLPEMIRGTSIHLIGEDQARSVTPLVTNRGRGGLFVERGMKGGWRGGGVDKVPLERRLSVQQVRDLLPYILQRVCARYPTMSRILLSFDARSANFTSVVNIHGLALIQAVTANLWRMMQGDKERLVLYAMEDDDATTKSGGEEGAMRTEVAYMLSAMLHAVTDLVPEEKIAADPSEGMMGKWAAMRSLSLVLMGTHLQHNEEERGKDEEAHGPFSLFGQAECEDWTRDCCCTELPIPTKAQAVFDQLHQTVAKGCYAEGIRLVAAQARYVAYHDLEATMSRSDVLNPPEANAVIELMSKLSMATEDGEVAAALFREGIKDSEWGIRTLEESNDRRQREQEKLREELPVGMAIGLYLRALANALRGETRRMHDVSGGASHVWQQDEKLWRFLGAGALDLVVGCVDCRLDDSGSGGSGSSRNLCVVEHDPIEAGDREAAIGRIRMMLPLYVRNTLEYVQGNAPLPYLFLTPRGACFSGHSMIPNAGEVVKEMRFALEQRDVVDVCSGFERDDAAWRDADKLEVFANALSLTEGVRVWGPALQDFLLRIADELEDNTTFEKTNRREDKSNRFSC